MIEPSKTSEAPATETSFDVIAPPVIDSAHEMLSLRFLSRSITVAARSLMALISLHLLDIDSR